MTSKRNLKDEDDYNSVDEDEPKIAKKNKGTAAAKPISKSKSRDDSDDDDDVPLYRDDDEEDDKSSKKKSSQAKDTKSKAKEEKPKEKPRMSKNDRKKYTADGVEIEFLKDDEIMFHIQAKKKVVVSKFKNQPLVSIREYFEKNGDILPTKKGVSLTKEGWNTLKSCIADIDEQIKNL